MQYPSAIKGIAYNPNFAIRGLHCDITKGFLMKIDAYNQIQLSSVYRLVGCERVWSNYQTLHDLIGSVDRRCKEVMWLILKLYQFLTSQAISEEASHGSYYMR